MSSANLETSSSNNQTAFIEELIRGRELARQLGALIQEQSPRTGNLVEGVMSSLSRALMLMDAKKTESSEGNRKVQLTQRGGYRRRSHPYSYTNIISQTTDDGHRWRKYGQKAIYHAKFPRSYFRCTHKFDQNCKATRQVQQSEEDPSLFVITYFGEHTCKDYAQLKSSFNIQEDHCIIDFASYAKANCNDQQQQNFPILSKQECDDEVSNNLTLGSSISTECIEFQELQTLESDGTSGLMMTSTNNLGWDFSMDDTLEFNDLFEMIHWA